MMPDIPGPSTASFDLAAAEAMLDRLPAYLDANALFQSVTVSHDGHVHHVTLTLGNLIERIAAVRDATFDDPDMARRAIDVLTRHDALRAAHRAAYAARLHKELRSHDNALRAAREDAADEGGTPGGDGGAARRHEAAIRRLRDEGRAHGLPETL